MIVQLLNHYLPSRRYSSAKILVRQALEWFSKAPSPLGCFSDQSLVRLVVGDEFAQLAQDFESKGACSACWRMKL